MQYHVVMAALLVVSFIIMLVHVILIIAQGGGSSYWWVMRILSGVSTSFNYNFISSLTTYCYVKLLRSHDALKNIFWNLE